VLAGRRSGRRALAISAISVREMRKGVELLRARKPDVADALGIKVQTIFDAYDGRTLATDRAVAERWGELPAASDKHVDDTGLSATAYVHGLTVVTRNTKDLHGRGVALLDPFKSPKPRSTPDR
jgi:hypothetical protein